MENKKTIIFIGQLPPIITGQSLVTLNVYNILKNQGANIKVHNLAYSEFTFLKKYVILIRTFLKITIDIINFNSVIYLSAARSKFGFYRNAYIILLSNLFNRKIIVHFHCGEFNEFVTQNGVLFEKFAKFLFSKVDSAIILGKSLIKNYELIFNDKMQIIEIPNGISVKKVINNKWDKKFINLLFMSNLIESKGYLDVIEAVNILVNDYKIYNLRLDICGKFINHEDNVSFKNIDEYVSHFRDQISKKKLNDFVKYHSVVTGDEKELLFQNCDIFILPTYYSTEAQPLSILEALSYGKIVITTNHRGIPDMVINNFNGLIVEKKSPKGIAKAILEVIYDDNIKIKFSKNAINHVTNNFSIEKFEINIIELFTKFKTI